MWTRTALAVCLCVAAVPACAEGPAFGVTAHEDAAAWRTVTLGTRKGVTAYRAALAAAAVTIGDAADEILGRPRFPYASEPREIRLVVLSGRELGVTAAEPLAGLYARARRQGLELCPAEVGPLLRLAYRDQPRGETLHIAMEPVATWDGTPTILVLANYGRLLLIGSDGRADFMVPREARFVFAHPAAPPQQARWR
jgi:hypothetical protein